MNSIFELEQALTEPSDDLIREMEHLEGDLMILGVGGKMGPTLAKLAKNAADKARVQKRIIGVSRFSDAALKEDLENNGIETISADLLDDEQLQQLPNVKNIIFMAGQKFGTTGRESFTWAMNVYLPGRVAEKFKSSRIVSLSTGNVYPLTPISAGGATEETRPDPVGEYAQSCLGRERIFTYFSQRNGTPMLHFRLNYAIDLRYGILLEIANAVKTGQPVHLEMGHVNVIWQGDANERVLRSLSLCDNPPQILNITGPETISVRWVAEQFAKRLNVEPVFVGEEQETALLSNSSKSNQIFGYPKVTLSQMMEWQLEWVESGGKTLEKPTHFQERQGAY